MRVLVSGSLLTITQLRAFASQLTLSCNGLLFAVLPAQLAAASYRNCKIGYVLAFGWLILVDVGIPLGDSGTSWILQLWVCMPVVLSTLQGAVG